MKTQASFSGLEYAAKKKRTRRDRFLGDIDALTPWRELVAVIEPFYPKGSRGRPPIGVERMLRMYVAQQCFGLSDEGIEDAVTTARPSAASSVSTWRGRLRPMPPRY